MLKVVLFGAGSPLSIAVRERLRPVITHVVMPRGCKAWTDQAVDFAQAPELTADLFVVASFPHMITPALIEKSRAGAVNLHPSLLPHLRGPDPLFWTYFNDDREAGITLHVVTERLDAGDVLARHAVPLARGRDVSDLYPELATAGAAMIGNALESIVDGSAVRESQDESLATQAPRADKVAIDFARWPSERVWHVLSGLGSRRNDLLPVTHGRATAFEQTAAATPGRIEKHRGAYRVHCADGWVDVAAAPLAARVKRVARRLLRK